jgi:Spy/CpxP family protein refolding chaperone
MRFKMIAILALVTGLSVSAGATAAQDPGPDTAAQAPTGQSEQGQQQPGNRARPGRRPRGGEMRAGGMMNPDMMRMMQTMGGPERGERRGRGFGGPLQRVSRLLAALDDPRVRTVLGLTDEQADGLRKIIVGTETFTIKTGADIAVDSIDLRELLRADKPDRAAVRSKGDEISKSTSQLINHYLDAILAAKAVLTPEQQKMIRAYIESGAPALPVPLARP